MLAAAVWLGVVELVESRNDEAGEGEVVWDVAAAAGVCVGEVEAVLELSVAAVFALSDVAVV